MKKKNRIWIFPLILMGSLLIFAHGCKKESKPELPEISIVNISQESDWDYWVVGKNDYYYLKTEDSLPKWVLFHSSEAEKNYSIFFTEDGMLDKVAVDDYIFVFRNFNGSKVDIGILNPTGDIEILTEVETNYDWTTTAIKKGNSSVELSDVIRLTGRIVGFVPCAISAAKAYYSAGILAPLAVWTCGNYFLKLSADIETHEFNVYDGFTEFTDTYSDLSIILNCTSDLISCAFSASARGYSQLADYLEQIENERSEDIQTIESSLSKINNTTWDVTIFFNSTTNWHADVTFYSDGTTKYDEPANPGVYLLYGVWSINNDKIHWSEPYIFDGTITGNTMSGTFVYAGETKTWSAIKRQ